MKTIAFLFFCLCLFSTSLKAEECNDLTCINKNLIELLSPASPDLPASTIVHSHLMIASNFIHMGEFDKAEEYRRKAEEINPKIYRTSEGLAYLITEYLHQKDYKRAVEIMSNLEPKSQGCIAARQILFYYGKPELVLSSPCSSTNYYKELCYGIAEPLKARTYLKSIYDAYFGNFDDSQKKFMHKEFISCARSIVHNLAKKGEVTKFSEVLRMIDFLNLTKEDLDDLKDAVIDAHTRRNKEPYEELAENYTGFFLNRNQIKAYYTLLWHNTLYNSPEALKYHDLYQNYIERSYHEGEISEREFKLARNKKYMPLHLTSEMELLVILNIKDARLKLNKLHTLLEKLINWELNIKEYTHLKEICAENPLIKCIYKQIKSIYAENLHLDVSIPYIYEIDKDLTASEISQILREDCLNLQAEELKNYMTRANDRRVYTESYSKHRELFECLYFSNKYKEILILEDGVKPNYFQSRLYIDLGGPMSSRIEDLEFDVELLSYNYSTELKNSLINSLLARIDDRYSKSKWVKQAQDAHKDELAKEALKNVYKHYLLQNMDDYAIFRRLIDLMKSYELSVEVDMLKLDRPENAKKYRLDLLRAEQNKNSYSARISHYISESSKKLREDSDVYFNMPLLGLSTGGGSRG